MVLRLLLNSDDDWAYLYPSRCRTNWITGVAKRIERRWSKPLLRRLARYQNVFGLEVTKIAFYFIPNGGGSLGCPSKTPGLIFNICDGGVAIAASCDSDRPCPRLLPRRRR